MKINIRSMKYPISQYKHLLEKKLDFDKHYHVFHEGVHKGYYGAPDKTYKVDGLKDVEVGSIEEMFDIFSEFEEGMGVGYGHITVDVLTGDILILDSWIE